MTYQYGIKKFLMLNYGYIKAEFLVFLAAIISPTVPMLFFIGFLIFVDTFSGVWSSVKREGWSSFKSKRLSLGLLPKLIFYPLAVLLAQAMENQFPAIPFMKTVGFFIMTIEIKSVSENYKSIFGVSVFETIKHMINKKIDSGNNG